MKIKNYKKLKWIGLTTAIGAISIGVGCKAAHDIKVASKLCDSNFKNDGQSNINITWERIDQYYKSVLDKIAASLWNIEISKGTSESLAQDIVQKQCGVFVNNLLPYMDHTKTDSDSLNQAYAQIKFEAQKIGIDVVDWNDFDKTEKNQIINSYYKQLTAHGVSTNDAKSTTAAYLQQIDDVEESGKDFMWDHTQMNLQLINNLNNSHNKSFFYETISKKNNLTSFQEQDRLETARLNVALSYIESSMDTRLSLSSNCATAINLIKEYSSTGKYTQGSEIDKNDLQYFFNYQYDPSYGALLTTPKFDYSSPVSGDYDYQHLNFQTQNLSTYSINNGPSYQTGEILPGYTLHAKILSEDVDTEANFCNLTFQFGISETNTDPYGQNVVWSNLDQSGQDKDSPKIMNIKMPIYDIKNKKYIASNRYYKDLQGVEIPTSEYNSKYDAYYVDNADQRKYLDELLSFFAPDVEHYDFKDYPIYIPVGDYTGGINAPSSNSNAMHATERYLLKISDIDTNVTPDTTHAKCVKVNWCVINTAIPSDTNSSSAGDQENIQDIPWIIGDKTVDTCWIYYDINPDLQTNISYGTEISTAMKIYNEMEIVKNNIDPKTIKKAVDERIALDVLNAAFLVALTALTIAETAWSAITFGSRVAVIALLIAAATTTTTYVVINGIITREYIRCNKFWKWYKGQTDNLFSSQVIINTINDIASKYDQLLDPTLSFEIKNNISIQIMNDVKTSGIKDRWLQFIRNVVEYENNKANMDQIDQILNDLKQEWENRDPKGLYGWSALGGNVVSEALLSIRMFGKAPARLNGSFLARFFNTTRNGGPLGDNMVGRSARLLLDDELGRGGDGGGAFEEAEPETVIGGAIENLGQDGEAAEYVDGVVGGLEGTHNKGYSGVLSGVVAIIISTMQAITMTLSNVFDGQQNK